MPGSSIIASMFIALLKHVDWRKGAAAGRPVLKPVAGHARFKFSLQVEQRVEWIGKGCDHLRTHDAFFVMGWIGFYLRSTTPRMSIWVDTWQCQGGSANKIFSAKLFVIWCSGSNKNDQA